MRTRLAPSPTGALHLGNARTFLVNWLLARQNGWEILLRIEDIDGPRIKPQAAQQAMDDLRWLGIDWDQGPIFQSTRLPHYTAAINHLITIGAAYPCICTRKEIDQAASAPHAEDGAAIYPNTCRDRFASVADATRFAGRPPAIRFKVPDQMMHWTDQFAGPQQCNPAAQLGDFVIAKSDGTPAYQLAVVVDDLDSQITHIVRGDDLLDSTPRQILLYQLLGKPQQIPIYFHLPLIVGPDGRRLAKRHGDSRLNHYKSLGVPQSKILKLLANWCAISATPSPGTPGEGRGEGEFDRRTISSVSNHPNPLPQYRERGPESTAATDLIERFNPATMSKDRIIFTPEDEKSLLT